MYSSPSISKHIISVPFFAIVVATQLMFICNVSSLNLTNTYLHHKCLVSQGKYKPGSTYEKALNEHIQSLSKGNFRNGFYHGTMGEDPNYVTIIYQCRGDTYLSKCQSCFNVAISMLRKRCPENKGGMIWFDQCFVEVTNIRHRDAIIERMFDHKNDFSLYNPNKVSGDAKLFNKETMAFLGKLTLQANNKDNKNKDGEMALYAAGERGIGTNKMYTMVQCTRYLHVTPKMCKECLDTIIREFPKCCDGKQGGRILGTSCNFRYELYPFLKIN